MAQLFADAARAYLSAGIAAGDTTIGISSGGALFPVANGTDWFKAVLQDASGIEIVYVTAHTSASTVWQSATSSIKLGVTRFFRLLKQSCILRARTAPTALKVKVLQSMSHGILLIPPIQRRDPCLAQSMIITTISSSH